MAHASVVKQYLKRFPLIDDASLSARLCDILGKSCNKDAIIPAIRDSFPINSKSEVENIANDVIKCYLLGILPDALPSSSGSRFGGSGVAPKDEDLDGCLEGLKASASKKNRSAKANTTNKHKPTKDSSVDLIAAMFDTPPIANAALGVDDAAADDVKVCRHFIAGKCLRGDCPFIHTTSSIPCKFFASVDGCAAGDACKFEHRLPVTVSAHAEAASTEVSDAIDDDVAWAIYEYHMDDTAYDAEQTADTTDIAGRYDELFPAVLPSSTILPAGSGKGDGDGLSTAKKVAILSLRASFPRVAASIIEAAYAENGQDYGRTRAHLMSTYKLEDAMAQQHVERAQSRVRPSYDGVAKAIMRSVTWTTTGAHVAEIYKHHRASAEALARSRNEALHRATQAYIAGRKAEAAKFSAQGRILDQQMKEAHRTAAAAIYSARNADSPQEMAGQFVRLIDLHGLHGSEAADMLDNALQAAQSYVHDSGVPCLWLILLVGTRHHSLKLGKGGGSIRDAIVEALEDRGEPFYEISTAVDAAGKVLDGAGMVAVRVADK